MSVLVSEPLAVPLRADAARNLRRILTAAAEAFAEQGGDVAMEEIARRAGVGVGTLYRRFPDREALVVAVVRDSFATLAETMRVAQLFALVFRAGRPDGGRGSDLASSRALAVVLDGLRTGGHTALPGRPLAPRDLTPP
jgi:AcrR family transcriptional regulator